MRFRCCAIRAGATGARRRTATSVLALDTPLTALHRYHFFFVAFFDAGAPTQRTRTEPRAVESTAYSELILGA
jgi:hypothetical protein